MSNTLDDHGAGLGQDVGSDEDGARHWKQRDTQQDSNGILAAGTDKREEEVKGKREKES